MSDDAKKDKPSRKPPVSTDVVEINTAAVETRATAEKIEPGSKSGDKSQTKSKVADNEHILVPDDADKYAAGCGGAYKRDANGNIVPDPNA